MNCAKCQHAMIRSKESWLCMNCGHAEVVPAEVKGTVIKDKSSAMSAKPTEPTPAEPIKDAAADNPSTGPGQLDQPAPAVTVESAAGSDFKPIVPDLAAASPSAAEPVAVRVNAATPPTATTEPTPMATPESEPAPVPVTEPKPEPEPTREAEPEPTSKAQPSPAPQSETSGPTAPRQPEPVPAAEPLPGPTTTASVPSPTSPTPPLAPSPASEVPSASSSPAVSNQPSPVIAATPSQLPATAQAKPPSDAQTQPAAVKPASHFHIRSPFGFLAKLNKTAAAPKLASAPVPPVPPVGQSTTASPEPVPQPMLSEPTIPTTTPPVTSVPIVSQTTSNQPANPSAVPPPAGSSQSATTSPTDLTAPGQANKSTVLPVAIIALVITLAGTGGMYAYQAFAVAPKQALANYLQTARQAKTSQFRSVVTERTDGQQTTITASGSLDIGDPANPSYSQSTQYQSGQNNYTTDYLVANHALYYKASNTNMDSVSKVKPNQWYKFDVAAEDTRPLCVDSWRIGLGAVEETGLKSVVQAIGIGPNVVDPELVSYSAIVEGRRARYYRGRIDVQALPAQVVAANNSLPDACDVDLSDQQVAGLEVSYELWESSDFHRLKLVISDRTNNLSYEITYDSFAYNVPVSIEPPAAAQTLAVKTPSAEEVRDNERRSELQALQTALEEYFAKTGRYPAASNVAALKAALVPKYIDALPADPLDNGGHTYIYRRLPAGCSRQCSGYELLTDLEAAVGHELTYKLHNAQ